MALFDTIKKFAKLRGMSVKEVAVRSGMSENAIYNWKKHTPSNATLMTVAQTLGIDPSELTGVKQEVKPTKIDLKAAAADPDTVMSWNGRPIPPEEMEMIRRILEGGK